MTLGGLSTVFVTGQTCSNNPFEANRSNVSHVWKLLVARDVSALKSDKLFGPSAEFPVTECVVLSTTAEMAGARLYLESTISIQTFLTFESSTQDMCNVRPPWDCEFLCWQYDATWRGSALPRTSDQASQGRSTGRTAQGNVGRVVQWIEHT